MALIAVSCQCGSVESLIRNFLQKAGYPDFLTIPIHQGREKSRQVLRTLPKTEELRALDHYLESATKWAVIIGTDGENLRWSDIAHNATYARIEAELIVETFAP